MNIGRNEQERKRIVLIEEWEQMNCLPGKEVRKIQA